MVRNYDFVVTSGGIGPTHDGVYHFSPSPVFQSCSSNPLKYSHPDITYASLAKSFSQRLVHHPETLTRMGEMNKYRPWVATQNTEQRAATQRMALFPENAEVLFVGRDLWVVSCPHSAYSGFPLSSVL